MKLRQLYFNYLVADQDIPCDAIELWLKIADTLTMGQREKGIKAWGWGAAIKKGRTYYQYVFVDEEDGSGEMMVLNVKTDMDNYMRALRLYPPIIMAAIDKFTI